MGRQESDELDVVAVGSAIVDVLASATDADLATHGLVKGTMALVDRAESDRLYDGMGPAVEVSGGSAANTVAGVASFGGAAAFIGKVRDDQLGQVFRHDIRAVGVAYDTPPAAAGPATARCLVFVTPDAQRTMTTYLGAATALTAADIDESVVASAQFTYLEGYLWDPPEAIEALRRAVDLAHGAGRRVALSLSDPFCVQRHRPDFLHLVEDVVDVVFANELEAMSLFEVDTLAPVLDRLAALGRRRPLVAAVTLGAQGSVVVSGPTVVWSAAVPPPALVDTTGAGDLYAAGFLHGLTTGADLARCAHLGGLAAAEIISHIGARPQVPLATLVPV
jgi:sugar/nucleoside kinase (ribokinase family)